MKRIIFSYLIALLLMPLLIGADSTCDMYDYLAVQANHSGAETYSCNPAEGACTVLYGDGEDDKVYLAYKLSNCQGYPFAAEDIISANLKFAASSGGSYDKVALSIVEEDNKILQYGTYSPDIASNYNITAKNIFGAGYIDDNCPSQDVWMRCNVNVLNYFKEYLTTDNPHDNASYMSFLLNGTYQAMFNPVAIRGYENSQPTSLVVVSNFAPELTCPDQNTTENSNGANINLDIWGCHSDDDADSANTYSIVLESQPSLIGCNITSNRYLRCDPPAANRTGFSDILIQAEDARGKKGNQTLRVSVLGNALVTLAINDSYIWTGSHGQPYDIDLKVALDEFLESCNEDANGDCEVPIVIGANSSDVLFGINSIDIQQDIADIEFKAALQAYLDANCTTASCNIPLTFSSGSQGELNLSDLQIYYERINRNPTNSTIIYPNGGEIFDANSTIPIEWTLSADPDNDFVTYSLSYSNDSGVNWFNIVSDYGYENKLNDSSTEKDIAFSGNENKTVYASIPKSAHVTDAYLDLSGWLKNVNAFLDNGSGNGNLNGQRNWTQINYGCSYNYSGWAGGGGPGKITCYDYNNIYYKNNMTFDLNKGSLDYWMQMDNSMQASETDWYFSVFMNDSYNKFFGYMCRSQCQGDMGDCSVTSNCYILYNSTTWQDMSESFLSGSNGISINVSMKLNGTGIEYYNEGILKSTKNGYSGTLNSLSIRYSSTGENPAFLNGILDNINVSSADSSSLLLNPWLEIGAPDEVREWNYSGVFHTTEKTNDFSSSINSYLSTCSEDSTGYCTVPITLHSDTAGNISLSSINIYFNATDYLWDSTGLAELSSYKIRVRSSDGLNFSSWDESDTDFTISTASPNDTYKFIIQNPSGANIAWLGDLGNIVLKGTCTAGTTCNPPENSFIVKNSNDDTVAYIDPNGNICLESGTCSDNYADCDNPGDGSFIIRDETDKNVAFINATGGLCLTGGLTQNGNP